MANATQGFFRRHWLAAVGVAGGIAIPSLWLYLQLVVWKRHGDDLMLTAFGIVVTLALWGLLVAGIVRYWNDANKARALESKVALLMEGQQPLEDLVTTLKNEIGVKDRELSEKKAEIERTERQLVTANSDVSKAQEIRDQYRTERNKAKEELEALRNPPSSNVLPVELEPTKGKSDKLFLIVKNKSVMQSFRAQCNILSAKDETITTFTLAWESGAYSLPLLPEQSGKLLIATAGENSQHGYQWMYLCEINGGVPGKVAPERWSKGEKGACYRLGITVLGESTHASKSQRFTLQPGESCAMEMLFITGKSDGANLLSPLQVDALQLASNLRAFLSSLGPCPTPPKTDQDKWNHMSAVLLPWRKRLMHGYQADFADRVANIAHRLGAEGIPIATLGLKDVAVHTEKEIQEIAEQLALLSARLDFAPERKAKT